MSLEHHPSRLSLKGSGAHPTGADPPESFWYELIDEKLAALFLGLNVRTVQGYRQKGGGAKYVRLSARCIRYRRIDLRNWAESLLRESTSDVAAA